MRVRSIDLSWFRGAGKAAQFEPDCKSTIVYGPNGSGKSSFVDAFEYALTRKVGHLAHEYSGKNLKRALPNTHKPPEAKAELSIRFCDGSEVKSVFDDDGSAVTTGSMATALSVWTYRRTILRQDEVARFIHDTKGEKYSALLPLLGLHQLEVAAENIRQLTRNVESLSQIEGQERTLATTSSKRSAVFRADSDAQILKRIEELHGEYCADKPARSGPLRCEELMAALDSRGSQLSADQKRHLGLRTGAEVSFKPHIDAVRAANSTLAGAADPLISEKIAVLQPTESLLAKLTVDGEVGCPACGQRISAAKFREHVRDELEHLREVRAAFNQRGEAIGKLCEAVKVLSGSLGRAELESWREDVGQGPLAQCLRYMAKIDPNRLRISCTESDLEQIETNLIPLAEAAKLASIDTPPDVQQLWDHRRVVDAAKDVFNAIEITDSLTRAKAVISVLTALERAVREEIKVRSVAVISEISQDIKDMWLVLHPYEAIDDVHLYWPEDTEKGIDIGLKFYGKELKSPRLTLSEGYRNGLGLCVFLAMAKRESSNDRPIFLDDVVLSLDRNHRGMIAQLLEKEFRERQVIILTHDRDWFIELRQRFHDGHWKFDILLPYQTPDIGIRWASTCSTFAEAQAQLSDRPDAAGNDARKIMELELASVAEHLRIRLPFLRFDKNDRRGPHEFLERIVADGKKCFRKTNGSTIAAYDDALESLRLADQLIISWANRGSHSFDVVRPEATMLIDVCEKALNGFKCTSCGKAVWFSNAAGAEWVQCRCGNLQWRYGNS